MGNSSSNVEESTNFSDTSVGKTNTTDEPNIDFPDPPAFGRDMRLLEFNLDPTTCFLNQASYGTVPKKILAEQVRLLEEFDRDPDKFTRISKRTYWDENVAAIASFLGSLPGNITFVENSTRALNNCIKSVSLSSGDAILCNNWTYTAVRNTIDEVVNRTPGVTTVVVTHALPIASREEIIQQYRTTLDNNPNIKLAIIDHVSSVPAVRFPIEELIPLFHERNVIVGIDGAHAPGQIPLNLEALGADFYVGSCHKWMFAPRGTGIQYLLPVHQSNFRPAVTSFDYAVPFPNNLFIQGTRDDGNYFCIKECINFIDWIGGMDGMAAYNIPLIEAAIADLASAWGTERFPIPVDMEAPYIRNIRLPDLADYGKTPEEAGRLNSDLFQVHNIWGSISFQQGELYNRTSVNVYYTAEDYQRFRDVILMLKAKK